MSNAHTNHIIQSKVALSFIHGQKLCSGCSIVRFESEIAFHSWRSQQSKCKTGNFSFFSDEIVVAHTRRKKPSSKNIPTRSATNECKEPNTPPNKRLNET